MKKIGIISAIAIALAAVVLLGYTGWAYAQSEPSVCPVCADESWRGGRGGFNEQGFGGEDGPLHEIMLARLAEAFDMTPEALQAAHAEGKTLWEIAQEQGKTYEKFQALILEARTKAFEQMVAEGVISQAQAAWMLERMNGAQSGGYGPGRGGVGGCGMASGDSLGQYPRMRGGRWGNQP